MAKSFIDGDKACYYCGAISGLHCHHIFGGTANRKISERLGYKVWLCPGHHTGPAGPHLNRQVDLDLKRMAQRHYEEHRGTREDFIKTFGKSWL